MAPTAWYRTETSSAYDADEAYAELDVVPRDRIGSPLANTRKKRIRRATLVLVTTLGAGYAVYSDPSILPRSWAFANDTILPVIGRIVSGSAEPAPPAVASNPAPALAEPPPLVEAPPAPPQPAFASMAPNAAGPAAASITTAAIPAPAASETPAPPKAPPNADPNRKRAEAVGLHPDLSPVLLARLSKADYDNARVAINTAVVETTDNGIFVWPRQRKPGLALFEVSFVPSTTPDCRRYIVTIAKDGWLTTALPVEKCGVRRVEPKKPSTAAAKAASPRRPTDAK